MFLPWKGKVGEERGGGGWVNERDDERRDEGRVRSEKKTVKR